MTLFAHFPDGLATRGVDLALQIKLNISSNLQEVETPINNSKFHEGLIRPSLGGDTECTVKVSTKFRGMPLLALSYFHTTCPEKPHRNVVDTLSAVCTWTSAMQLVLGTLAHMSGSWPRPGSRLAMVTQPSTGSSSSTVNTPGPKGSLHQLIATRTYLIINIP